MARRDWEGIRCKNQRSLDQGKSWRVRSSQALTTHWRLVADTHCRSLATSWEQATNPAMSTYGYPNPLNQISMFVLLDRLGSAGGPEVPSYFQTSAWAYQAMSDIERRLRGLSLLETPPSQRFLPETGKQPDEFGAPPTGNDHVPFMERGVPVLGIFPDASKVPQGLDGPENVDQAAVKDWAKILTGFAFEWLDMSEVEPGQGERRRRRKRGQS